VSGMTDDEFTTLDGAVRAAAAGHARVLGALGPGDVERWEAESRRREAAEAARRAEREAAGLRGVGRIRAGLAAAAAASKD
jgi:hypothetical protein